MATELKVSACHNAVTTERGDERYCGVCSKPCELADPDTARAEIEASGRTEEQIMEGVATAPAVSGKLANAGTASGAKPTVSTRMGRERLEEIALEEGATAEEIEACTAKDALIELINAKRA